MRKDSSGECWENHGIFMGYSWDIHGGGVILDASFGKT